MKRETITCHVCNGTGKEHLNPELSATLAILRRSKKPITAGEIPATGVGVTAINNRLNELQKLGLAERVGKAGRNILWIAIKSEK